MNPAMRAILLISLATLGCGKPFLNIPLSTAKPLAAADLEYEVYSEFLGSGRITAHIVDSTYGEPLCLFVTREGCRLRSSPPAQFAEALADYEKRNGKSVPIRPGFAATVNAHVVTVHAVSDLRCGQSPILVLSRVGFNADSTAAVLGYSVSYGCHGFASGGILGYRRLPGHRWTFRKSLSGWIT